MLAEALDGARSCSGLGETPRSGSRRVGEAPRDQDSGSGGRRLSPSGRPHQIPQGGGFQTIDLHFSRFQRLGVQGQGALTQCSGGGGVRGEGAPWGLL